MMDSEDNKDIDNEELDNTDFQDDDYQEDNNNSFDNASIGYSPYFNNSGFGNKLSRGPHFKRGNEDLKDDIEKNKTKNTANGNAKQKNSQSDNTNNEDNKNENSDNTSNLNNGKSRRLGVFGGSKDEVNEKSSILNLFDIKFPTGTRLKIIIGVIIVVIVLLLSFVLLMGASSIVLKMFDKDNETESELGYSSVGDDSGFWWPVGSNETTTKNGKTFASGQPALTSISSPFSSYRALTGRAHYGFDIGSGGKIGVYNLIAIKSGTVIKVNNTCEDNGYLGNGCGGQLGNYVTIDHGNGYYSRYQHMAKNSITVNVGDTVEQGQVIGKIGKSGSCTGAHLHFQIHVGGTSNSYAVNPEKYVSASNPRPKVSSSSGSELVKMIQYFEGTGPVSGNSYVAYKYSYDVLTIGHGVTIPYNKQRFKAHGIDPNSIRVGTKISISIIDAIEAEIIQEHYNNVVSTLSSSGISLKNYQIDALTSRHYNTGNISGFSSAYKSYGDTIALYNNYMSRPVTAGGRTLSGLARRRQAEWKLFHEGIYTY